jgi:PAS domain S-box-containing protein
MTALHVAYSFSSNKKIKVWAVVSIAILFLSNLLVIQYFISQKTADDRIINIARKQRTLSQNITRLVFENNLSKTDLLDSRIREWTVNHDALTGEIKDNRHLEILEDSVKINLQKLKMPMSEIVRYAKMQETGFPLSALERNTLAATSDDFLSGMDAVVNQYQTYADKKLFRTIYYMIIVGMLTMIVLLLEFIFLFAPLLKSLRKINEQQDLIINGVAAGVWDWDIENDEQWWSPAFYDLLGYSPDDLEAVSGKFINELVHPKDREKAQTAIREHLENHKPYKIPVRVKTKNGDYKWFETAGKAIQNSKGQNIRMAGSIIDIDKQMTAQLELEKNDILIREVGKMAKIGGWEIDLKTMKPYWSEAVYDIHEIPYDEEPDVENAFKFYEAGYEEMAREKLKIAIEQKQSYEYEYRFITAKGRHIWVRVMGKPVLDEEGNVIALRGVIQDIDEERRAKEEVAAIHNELFSIYSATTEVSIISTDLTGKIVHFNKGAENLLGYTRDEMVGKETPAIIHLPEEIEERGKVLSMEYDKKIEGFDAFVENAKHDKIDSLEWTYVRKNGEQFPVQLVITAVKDENSQIKGFLGIATDISLIKDAEKALKESESKYRRIFENVQDVFYMTDQNGIVTEISPSIEKYSGYKRSTIIGHPVADFYYYVEDRERLLEAITKTGSVIDFEVRLKTADGQLRFASVNARMVIEGGRVGTEGSMRDITIRKLHEEELEALNAKLKALNEQKNKLLSVIAHDLRNPIAGCLSLLNLAFMDIEASTKEDLTEYLNLMRDATSNANALLEELLEWAKSQFNSVNFDPVEIDDLPELITNCIKKIKPLAESKSIEIVESIPKGIFLSADKNMLETIIRNLATNALKYTNNGGTVIISAEEDNKQVTFKVSDTGIGIPPDVIGKLFDKTSDYTSFGTAGEKGIGLGLDLSFDFVEKHGGKIWVDSTVGKGSTFSFTIPA